MTDRKHCRLRANHKIIGLYQFCRECVAILPQFVSRFRHTCGKRALYRVLYDTCTRGTLAQTLRQPCVRIPPYVEPRQDKNATRTQCEQKPQHLPHILRDGQAPTGWHGACKGIVATTQLRNYPNVTVLQEENDGLLHIDDSGQLLHR